MAFFFGFYDYVYDVGNNSFGFIQQVGVVAGIGLFLLGGSRLFPSFWQTLFGALFVFSVFLLSLNIYGEFAPLRNPKIEDGVVYFNTLRKPEVPLEQVARELEQLQGETNEEYAYRLTDLVYSATVHKWEDVTDYTEYNHQIPAHENYFLWALSYLDPGFRFYQFCDPYKAIERGVMICAQATETVANQWKEMGMKARNMVLEGHVVAEVQVDEESDTWWVLDADLGVVFEHDIATLEEHPEVVLEKYLDAGYDSKTANMITDFFGKEGNYVQSNVGICPIEENLYRWKWYFPIGLLIPSTLYFGLVWLKRRDRFPVA